MPENKQDFFNLAELSQFFHAQVTNGKIEMGTERYFMTAAMLAQAQQMAVIAAELKRLNKAVGQPLFELNEGVHDIGGSLFRIERKMKSEDGADEDEADGEDDEADGEDEEDE